MKAQCISANETAQDLRGAGKLLEARAQLALCVAESCPGPVRQDCAVRLVEIDKAQPTLVIVAQDASGTDVGGVRATIDGKPQAAEINGTAIQLDPGEHRLVLEAAGHPPVEKTLVLHEGEKNRREVVTFAGGPAPAPATTVESTPTPDQAHENPTTASAPSGKTQRMIALGVGGAGAVGLIVGGVFAFVAKSTYDHAINSECGSAVGYASSTSCSAQGSSDVQSAYGQATAATVSVIVGAALVGAGAALYFTAPKAGISAGASVGSGTATVSLRGAW
jgi:hypothetical protein